MLPGEQQHVRAVPGGDQPVGRSDPGYRRGVGDRQSGHPCIHASVAGPLFHEAERSRGVDIAVFGDVDGTKADLIDGSIGEASIFHDAFGYYAQGVTESTAVLRTGWRDRLVRYEPEGAPGIVAWCLEPHDLWIAKAIAHRPRDLEFCRAMRAHGLVDAETLAERLRAVEDISDEPRAVIAALIGT